MTSQHVHKNSSGKRLNLPEPDADNITVLTRNLPNKPILPWHRYDSPWRDPQVEPLDESEILDTDEVADTDEDEEDSSEPIMADTPDDLEDDSADDADAAKLVEGVTEFVEKSEPNQLEEAAADSEETEGLAESVESAESVELDSESADVNPREEELDEVENLDEENPLVAHLSEKLGISDRQADDEEDDEEFPEDEDHEDHELKQLG